MFKKYFLIFFVSIILSNCSGVKETLSLKKKTSTNEFLVKKKNPLVMPPEFETLPTPIDNPAETTEEEVLLIDEEIDISKLLKNNSNKKKQPQNSSKSLEKSISDLLKDK